MSSLRAKVSAQAKEIDRLRDLVDELTDQKKSLQEQLEVEQVKNRIQRVEIEKLAAVCRRDLERVRSESDLESRHSD